MVWEPSNGFNVKISSFLKKVCKLKARMKIKCFRISEIHRGLKGISLVRCSFQLPPDQLLHPNWFQSKHLQSEECLPGSAVYGNKWKAGQKAGDAKVWWALQADLASAAGPRDAHNARSLVEPWYYHAMIGAMVFQLRFSLRRNGKLWENMEYCSASVTQASWSKKHQKPSLAKIMQQRTKCTLHCTGIQCTAYAILWALSWVTIWCSGDAAAKCCLESKESH